ncbi:MAG: DNA internalization-related competence protein ComEC/Rec2 [Planctomycetes bacterium]|nr:DNA internalization-related competence protein ComEC/Rec2 [Planctomycetota bacterium]
MSTAVPQLPVWSAPLAPVGLALTAGIVLDRFWVIALPASLGLAFISILAWLIFANTAQKWLALVYLWSSVAGLGAAYHHWHRHLLDADDISHAAAREPRPARLRGVLHTAPISLPAQRDPLRSFPTKDATRFVLSVRQMQDLTTRIWRPTGGRVQVTLIGRVDDITVGDEVELLGRLSLPGSAMNPGEFDYAKFLRDQGVTATLTVLDSDEVSLNRRGWPMSLFGWLAVVRGWGQRTLARDFSTQHAVAAALLLGEGSGMTGESWEQYLRTGVIHVLAISGQHFVVLAGFLWLLVRIAGVRRRQAAPVLAVLLIAYALLTGGRPPVMRAAWVVAAYCGGIVFQRPVSHANTFALAWIGVALVNPTDIFNAGCQLSFLAVAVLVWGVSRWMEEPTDPLKRLVDESRPWYSLAFAWLMRWVLASYALNAAVWLAVSPLVAAHYHTVSPIALLIGPPMVLLTSLGLLTGFAFLLCAGWCWPLALPFAWATQASLLGCEALVSFGQLVPGAYFFVADIPTWWLWILYVGMLLGLTASATWRVGRMALFSGAGWLVVGVLLQLMPHRPGELRCTFLAVGHGGCTVIETPNGRVIVYDAGATTGPDVTRRHIAPYLWSRGIRRIDTLILSHADLDHFNGVPQLLDRFGVGRVISTPTFAQRDLAGMQKTLSALQKRGIEIEIVHAGMTWESDGVSFEALHPPAVGPEGKENARSLVLLVRQADWSLLLTGDLEEAGLERVLGLPRVKLDVLMAPHHGSDKSNIPALAKWAKPKLVVSSQTVPISERESVAMYQMTGAAYLGTWPHGAITIRPGAPATQVETYYTKLRLDPF